MLSVVVVGYLDGEDEEERGGGADNVRENKILLSFFGIRSSDN